MLDDIQAVCAVIRYIETVLINIVLASAGLQNLLPGTLNHSRDKEVR